MLHRTSARAALLAAFVGALLAASAAVRAEPLDAVASIELRAGNVTGVREDGTRLPITDTGLDVEATASPTGQLVAIVRSTPGLSIPVGSGRVEGRELWLFDVRSGIARRVAVARPAGSGADLLAGFRAPGFSRDERFLFFLGASTSAPIGALHRLDLQTDVRSLVTRTSAYEIVREGQYADHLIVSQRARGEDRDVLLDLDGKPSGVPAAFARLVPYEGKQFSVDLPRGWEIAEEDHASGGLQVLVARSRHAGLIVGTLRIEVGDFREYDAVVDRSSARAFLRSFGPTRELSVEHRAATYEAGGAVVRSVRGEMFGPGTAVLAYRADPELFLLATLQAEDYWLSGMGDPAVLRQIVKTLRRPLQVPLK